MSLLQVYQHKLLYDYMPIWHICRLSRVCKSFNDQNKRNWDILKVKLIKSIGPERSINYVLSRVRLNKELVKEILPLNRIATGFILDNDGVTMLTQLVVCSGSDSDMIQFVKDNSPLSDRDIDRTISIIPPISLERKIIFEEFKKVMCKVPTVWALIPNFYMRGLLYNNINDYVINWDVINDWDKTDIWQYSRRCCTKAKTASIIRAFAQVGESTLKREKSNIISFIRRTFDPLVDHEIAMIEALKSPDTDLDSIDITGYKYMYPKKHDRHSMMNTVAKNSVIRSLVEQTAVIDFGLFQCYHDIAAEVFDLTNDEIIGKTVKSLSVSEEGTTTKIIEFLQSRYTLPVNIDLIFLMITKQIPLPKEAYIPKTNEQEVDFVFEADGIRKATIDATLLFKLRLVTDDFENLQTAVDFSDKWSSLFISSEAIIQRLGEIDNLPWTSGKVCQKRLEKMQELRMWDAIPKCFEVFLTYDLEFWKEFYEMYKDELTKEAPVNIQFIQFHIMIKNADFIKWLYANDEMPNNINAFSPQSDMPGFQWIYTLHKQYFPLAKKDINNPHQGPFRNRRPQFRAVGGTY